MSQFDAYTQSEYVQVLRTFLGRRHPAVQHLRESKSQGRKGRLPRYAADVIQALEASVNAEAARAESSDCSFAERFALACAYQGLKNNDVAQALGVSREIVRRWKEGTHWPSRLAELAKVLDVPLMWLQFGGERHLPANSSIGVRVGEEALTARERLYGLTIALLGGLPENSGAEEVMALLEEAVMTRGDMAVLARRAGGRWHALEGQLVFAPWVPLEEHGLARRYWSDEVEDIIAEELVASSSTYAAWQVVKSRCEALRLSYPRLVSLQRRVATQRHRAARYGVDLNTQVAAVYPPTRQ